MLYKASWRRHVWRQGIMLFYQRVLRTFSRLDYGQVVQVTLLYCIIEYDDCSDSFRDLFLSAYILFCGASNLVFANEELCI